MDNQFDKLREKIKEISMVDSSHLVETLLIVVDEVEKIYNEMRQGYTKPE